VRTVHPPCRSALWRCITRPLQSDTKQLFVFRMLPCWLGSFGCSLFVDYDTRRRDLGAECWSGGGDGVDPQYPDLCRIGGAIGALVLHHRDSLRGARTTRFQGSFSSCAKYLS
jgi:hypothetical protein